MHKKAGYFLLIFTAILSVVILCLQNPIIQDVVHLTKPTNSFIKEINELTNLLFF